MRIFYGSANLNFAPAAVALGDFDAIHKGHRRIIRHMLEYAEENGLLSVVYMFDSNFNKDSKRINTLEKRLEILESIGVDCCVVEKFTEEYKRTSCDVFAEEYINKRLNAKAVFVGFNYRFGEGASGDVEALKRLCRNQRVFVTPCVEVENKTVSSTEIKALIKQGNVFSAGALMDSFFSVKGRVVKGKQLGRTIGFPTANIEYPKETVVPMSGVYITRTKIGNNKYHSITNVGAKPTVMDESCNMETVLGNFSQDIYGKEIEIEFCKFIRSIEKFDSLEKLKEQLANDMKEAEEFFGKGDKNE